LFRLDTILGSFNSAFHGLTLPSKSLGSYLGEFPQIEAFHLKYLKQVLKLAKFTPNCMIYGELGRHKLIKTIEVRMVGFWCEILNSSEHKLSHMFLKALKSFHENGIYSSSWLSKVKSILDKAGMSYIWIIPDVGLPLHLPHPDKAL